ncbi:hypothetical protein AMES_0140 [Amycolatopsis mediterranei S699]|uniref:DUF5926 domain-containing protein n=2 Tax=Amycolatopsis mediterranei TaxID=33910 RepID=A0A0H3CTJ6_AMYMU|nr:DUF5926 family protein [Amycolatopsis mediterranei]ADJ41967.1 conserved hypothetical protein [Amycolatopsis mediterranei U32]AEK38641.1 hypothetical protein RAM_00730 [Amycolatopsis mediterranei S699]AFO73677.1 hypothetical protein AMES_0140 [Amycolatopsis mediterranei S699]AGT80806.1 hypothetical protein B737_0141 [Amycolatopsis mediterranei RB]KDO08799.1 preprotein translocase subunit SecA [Amycolatopsis mediterranei]
MGKGARKKGPKQASDRKPKVRDVFVGQPFEGLAAEPELIALREFVPSATAQLTLADGGDVTLGTVLPMAAAAFVRSDGRRYLGLQVQTRSSDISRDLGRSLKWLLDAKEGDVLGVPDTTTPPSADEHARLQDLLTPGAELDVTLHQDFGWWLPEDADATGDVAVSLERANAAIMPTERLGSAAYWVLAGEKAHLRWVRPEPENLLLQALARLSAAGELGLGEGSRYAGSFRAHGLLVPVWDLDPEAHAREWAEAKDALGARLETALKSLDDEPLNATERRARDGLIGRQLTLR